MALTATATKTLRRDVARIIGMRSELSRPPVKLNIMYSVVQSSLIEETFSSLVRRVQEDKIALAKWITRHI